MRLQDVVLAVIAGVVAWMLVLTGAGLVLAGIDHVTPSSILTIGLGLVVLHPVRSIYGAVSDAQGVRAAVDDRLLDRWTTFLLTVLLGLVSTLALMTGADSLLFDVLNLPYRGVTPMLYQVQTLYHSLLGGQLASLVFGIGTYYIQLLWLYLLSSGLLAITHKTRLVEKR